MFVKRLMLAEYRIEKGINQWVPEASWITTLFYSVAWRGYECLSYFDKLAQENPWYWMGRSVVMLGFNGFFGSVKNICQWAFTKSETEKQIIEHGLSLEKLSLPQTGETDSVRRKRGVAAARQEKRLEDQTLSWKDYGRVGSRIFIVYYVAWFVGFFAYSIFFPSSAEKSSPFES